MMVRVLAAAVAVAAVPVQISIYSSTALLAIRSGDIGRLIASGWLLLNVGAYVEKTMPSH